jgi:hypothetical protein
LLLVAYAASRSLAMHADLAGAVDVAHRIAVAELASARVVELEDDIESGQKAVRALPFVMRHAQRLDEAREAKLVRV